MLGHVCIPCTCWGYIWWGLMCVVWVLRQPRKRDSYKLLESMREGLLSPHVPLLDSDLLVLSPGSPLYTTTLATVDCGCELWVWLGCNHNWKQMSHLKSSLVHSNLYLCKAWLGFRCPLQTIEPHPFVCSCGKAFMVDFALTNHQLSKKRLSSALDSAQVEWRAQKIEAHPGLSRFKPEITHTNDSTIMEVSLLVVFNL